MSENPIQLALIPGMETEVVPIETEPPKPPKEKKPVDTKPILASGGAVLLKLYEEWCELEAIDQKGELTEKQLARLQLLSKFLLEAMPSQEIGDSSHDQLTGSTEN